MENQNKRPEDMPRQVKAQQPKLKEEKPGDALPPQQPLTDEETAPKQPPRWRKIVKKVLLWLGVVLALVLCYLFLLLGEPDEDEQLTQQPSQAQPITLPMSAVESPGDTEPGGAGGAFRPAGIVPVRQRPVHDPFPGIRHRLPGRIRPPGHADLCL